MPHQRFYKVGVLKSQITGLQSHRYPSLCPRRPLIPRRPTPQQPALKKGPKAVEKSWSQPQVDITSLYPGHSWGSCKAISSLHLGGGWVGTPEAVKVQLERKHSPEAEGICRFMTGLPEACGDQGSCPGLCLHPLQPAPTVGSAPAGPAPPVGGAGARGRFKLKLPRGPSSAEPPCGQGLLPSWWPNPVWLRILGSSNLPPLESCFRNHWRLQALVVTNLNPRISKSCGP